MQHSWSSNTLTLPSQSHQLHSCWNSENYNEVPTWCQATKRKRWDSDRKTMSYDSYLIVLYWRTQLLVPTLQLRHRVEKFGTSYGKFIVTTTHSRSMKFFKIMKHTSFLELGKSKQSFLSASFLIQGIKKAGMPSMEGAEKALQTAASFYWSHKL